MIWVCKDEKEHKLFCALILGHYTYTSLCIFYTIAIPDTFLVSMLIFKNPVQVIFEVESYATIQPK